MRNLSVEIKKKLQDLVDAGNLLEVLSFVDPKNDDMQALMLKSQVNSLLREKPLMTGASYHEAMEKIKENICKMIGLKYNESASSKTTTAINNDVKNTSIKIEQTRSRLEALSDRVEHLDNSDALKKHILSSNVTMLIARFQLLLQQKKNRTISEEGLSVNLNKINKAINQLNS